MTIERLGVHPSVSAVFPPERIADALAESAPHVIIAEDADSLAECDAIVTLEYEDTLLAVDWIHSIQAGVDRFPFDQLRAHDIVLTNSTGIHGDSVGETAVGYMLAFAHHLHAAISHQRDRRWIRPAWDAAFTVEGETVCVVGLGALGRGIAARADALDMRVIGVKRTVEPVPGVASIYPAEELHEAIDDARFVVLAVPLSEETEGLISQQECALMREDAYLINVARGGVVDEPALIEALQEGTIAGAALDVFETEPLPAESPLWDMDDVIITPHISGVTRDYYRGVADIVQENLQRLDSGDEYINRVV